ncbi:related to ubiquitin C-terminal hydrolase [Rhynchosporium graminicola]|uniref:ubiquitinyl hydrolase 1 n=1 Tax=Rhynchosporium graminicola TaxID=2792576 RepID=A0A1E1L8H7_9HELO|nr:related to ubiquitin C-terminal hydrolase [Rhynchosporium commune]
MLQPRDNPVTPSTTIPIPSPAGALRPILALCFHRALKLSPQTDNNPDIPLSSVEDPESQANEVRFEVPSTSDTTLPPHIPLHLQTSTSLGTVENIPSAASSPSAAYASLSLEGERGGDPESARTSSLAPSDQDIRAHSPVRHLSHRVIMGGAAEHPHRASSPLKRRASDLEPDASPSQKDDVDMIMVPESDHPEPTIDAKSSQVRAQSIDMLRNENQTYGAASSKTESGRLDEASAETTIPEIDEQIKIITTLIEAWNQEKPQEGAKAFLVSNRWMERVTSRGTEAKLKTKVDSDGEIGPIDNSDIVQQIIKDHKGKDFVQLKHGKGLDDFHLFPLDAWLIVSEWYGLMPGTLPIERFAHNTSQNGVESNIQFEFHPPVLTLHRAYGNGVLISQKLKVDRPAAPVFVLSTSTKYVDFLKMVKEAACIDIKSKVRVWLVPRLLPTQETTASVVNTATPPSSRPGSPVNGNVAAPASHNPQDSWTDLLLGVDTFLKLEKGSERYVLDLEDLSTNPKYNGSMTLAMAGIASDQNIVLDEYISKDGEWVTTWVQSKVKSGSTAIVRSGVLDKNGSNSQSNSGRNSPTPSGPMTRGRAQKYRKPSGTVGLNNLGNTCYMNSALQCVRSVEELTKYFLSGRAKEELNFDNALGNNGEVAIAYDRLLHEIYKDPSPNSVAPRNFKNVIGKYRAQFAGYGQQDSQEFLGFLLDGLQEDLSRVKKKPYIEKPDSTDEMVNNPEAIREMAAKVWDITKQRDDSVIADLFTGMYKSTLVCPTCSKVSITFDPFNNLTLQLPIHSSWKREVIFFPLHDKPISIRVDIDKNASIRVLKDFVSKRVGVPIERLLVMENHNSAFYKLHSDLMVVSEDIQPSDIIIVQEIERKPTNWPPRKVKKKKSFKTFSSNNDSEEDDLPDWDDEMAEHMIVPVLHRIEKNHYEKSQNPNTFSDQMIVGGMPFFIMVTPEEARSEETIKRKILEKVANLTTSAAFTNNDDADTSSADGADADIVLTTGSDADSSGDSKVVANSIDGEDELVDVTMKGPKSSSVLRKFNKRRPAFMNPGSQLNPDLQNMFDVCFTGDGKQTIPIGTGIINIRFKYPSIASRIPQTQQHDDNSPSQEYDAFGSPSGSESSNGTNGKTRMNDESSSSDEDEDLPALAPRVLPVRPAGPKSGVRVGHNKRGAGRLKTYSRKGKLSSRKVQSPRVVEQDAPDGGPLIRLGETLIVDWRRGAWDALFTGENPDELHGMAAWTKPKTLEDPDLEALQASRMLRKKNGIHLNDCLDEFGKEEILSEMDTWYCPRCKEHKRASKKFELWKTPDILIMHLKRFSSSGYRRDKVDVLVDFPIEGLDLSSRVIETEDGKQELYDLFAVDDHWGGLGGGHYTAFAKNYEDHEWYEYNDSHFTKQKDLSRIVSSSAYLLFYRRRSDVPLGGPRFLDIRGPDTSPQASDDDMSEAGEVKGLVGNSSLHGSSSALTGVGAARHQLSHGSPGEQMTTIDPSALENVPNYEGPFSLHQSIENDEGIDMGDPPPYASKWTTEGFRSLDAFPPSGYGASAMTSRADSDAASDNVNHGSSPDRESLDERLNDFNNAEAEDFIEQSPVPDMDESGVASAVGLQQDLLDSLNANAVQYPDHEFSVRAVDEESLELDDEPVTEIHLREDGDEFLKVE